MCLVSQRFLTNASTSVIFPFIFGKTGAQHQRNTRFIPKLTSSPRVEKICSPTPLFAPSGDHLTQQSVPLPTLYSVALITFFFFLGMFFRVKTHRVTSKNTAELAGSTTHPFPSQACPYKSMRAYFSI